MTYDEFAAQLDGLYRAARRYSCQGNDNRYDETLATAYRLMDAYPEHTATRDAEVAAWDAEAEAERAAQEAYLDAWDALAAG